MKTRTRKAPKSRPERKVFVTEPATPDVYTWTVRLTINGETSYYDLTPGTVAGGLARCWLIRRVKATTAESIATPPYAVVLDSDFGSSCDCKGYSRWAHCKHLSAVEALTAAGKLPVLEPICPECFGAGGPSAGDVNSDGCGCRSCGA